MSTTNNTALLLLAKSTTAQVSVDAAAQVDDPLLAIAADNSAGAILSPEKMKLLQETVGNFSDDEDILNITPDSTETEESNFADVPMKHGDNDCLVGSEMKDEDLKLGASTTLTSLLTTNDQTKVKAIKQI